MKTKKNNKRKSNALDKVVDLIERYEKGSATDVEREALDTWSPAADDTKHQIDDAECQADDERQSAFYETKVWQQLSKQFYLERTSHRVGIFRSLQFKWQRYAAVVTILILIGGGVWMAYRGSSFLQSETDRMADARKAWTTDDTHRTTLTLRDGSVVQVNAGSRFEMPEAAFNKQKREVWLSGEAFFKVAKNPKKPFIIHTGTMQTTVRGTSFNVKAYPQLNENVVSVRSGKVEVSDATHTYGLLTHNKQLRYNTVNRTTQITESNWEDAAGWTKGRLVLNGAGVEELRLRLRQQFGAEVTFEGDALAGQRLTGTFDPGSRLADVMTTIATIYNIRYKIKNNHVTINSFK